MHITLNEWLDTWIEAYIKNSKSENTYRCYKDSIRRIREAKAPFLDNDMRDITEIEMQAFINFLGKKYSKSTLNHARVVFDQAFATAIVNSYCERNPIHKLTLPIDADEKEIRALTLQEQEIVEEIAKTDPLGHIVLFFLNTGLRMQELCNLQWDDYNKKANYIIVRKSKTKAGIRLVPLIEEAKQILDAQPHYNRFIFNNTRKQPITENALKKLYLRLRTKTGIDFITNHVYRHSFATRLVEKGCEYKALSSLMGHTDVSFTLRRYATSNIDFLRQQINLLHK
ncbi:tyrosine-type recombinase/integrase [Faecalispora sporosphaeroides]|uniref:tyrosine-type recombinase/integrase n=1 Tax=Faecalispora sporosphaeroides TaxID=1549 RepID=UPI00037885C0|nr:site-specific integrase [Faecalispora sporosphaeroides]